MPGYVLSKVRAVARGKGGCVMEEKRGWYHRFAPGNATEYDLYFIGDVDGGLLVLWPQMGLAGRICRSGTRYYWHKMWCSTASGTDRDRDVILSEVALLAEANAELRKLL